MSDELKCNDCKCILSDICGARDGKIRCLDCYLKLPEKIKYPQTNIKMDGGL